MSINITVNTGSCPDNQISSVEFHDNLVNIVCTKGTVTITASPELCLSSIVNMPYGTNEQSDDEFLDEMCDDAYGWEDLLDEEEEPSDEEEEDRDMDAFEDPDGE